MMAFWVLAISYWVHLLATVIWFGGLLIMGVAAFPALREGELAENQWMTMQQRVLPWVNGSLLLLLITGFLQMTNDTNYGGFLQLDGIWAWAMLLKHVAYVGIVGLTVYLQVSVYPAMKRTAVFTKQRPKLAATELERLSRQETRLLRINFACAMLLLLCTAVATAV
ncbi:MAG: hypothetical protein GY943_09300 [Chloroflexi bacterium]|nr:hypothetical protein [Chloroflexota bacterium]